MRIYFIVNKTFTNTFNSNKLQSTEVILKVSEKVYANKETKKNDNSLNYYNIYNKKELSIGCSKVLQR